MLLASVAINDGPEESDLYPDELGEYIAAYLDTLDPSGGQVLTVTIRTYDGAA